MGGRRDCRLRTAWIRTPPTRLDPARPAAGRGVWRRENGFGLQVSRTRLHTLKGRQLRAIWNSLNSELLAALSQIPKLFESFRSQDGLKRHPVWRERDTEENHEHKPCFEDQSLGLCQLHERRRIHLSSASYERKVERTALVEIK